MLRSDINPQDNVNLIICLALTLTYSCDWYEKTNYSWLGRKATLLTSTHIRIVDYTGMLHCIEDLIFACWFVKRHLYRTLVKPSGEKIIAKLLFNPHSKDYTRVGRSVLNRQCWHFRNTRSHSVGECLHIYLNYSVFKAYIF